MNAAQEGRIMPQFFWEQYDEPGWSIDIPRLPADLYYVLAWIPPEVCGYQEDGRIVEYRFPRFHYEIPCQVAEHERDQCVVRLRAGARRIRDYLAWEYQMRLPLACRFVGVDLRTDYGWGADFMSELLLMQGIHEKAPVEFETWTHQKHEKVTCRLSRVAPDSTLDRVLCLWGGAVWEEGLQMPFMRLWSVLDVLADDRYENADRGEESQNRNRRKPSKLKLVQALWAEDLPDVDPAFLDQAYSLRNQVVHGDLHSRLDEQIDELLPVLARATHRLIEQRLDRLC